MMKCQLTLQNIFLFSSWPEGFTVVIRCFVFFSVADGNLIFNQDFSLRWRSSMVRLEKRIKLSLRRVIPLKETFLSFPFMIFASDSFLCDPLNVELCRALNPFAFFYVLERKKKIAKRTRRDKGNKEKVVKSTNRKWNFGPEQFFYDMNSH